jgi:hypothetical protein
MGLDVHYNAHNELYESFSFFEPKIYSVIICSIFNERNVR